MGEDRKKVKTIQISNRAIIMAVAVILILVVGAIVLTQVLPKGEYQRDDAGALIQGSYQENPELKGIAWWQIVLSPFMILSPTVEGSSVVYVIIALLLFIGAIFTALDESGILVYLIEYVGHKFKAKKYLLIPILSFAFMFLGSAVGMFEELIPLVPLLILLSYAMGWDALVGLGISLMAGCFGFAAGVVNPFTVGIAQTIGGLVLFSGIGLRLLAFGVTFGILMAFIIPYAKRIEKRPSRSSVYKGDLERKKEFDFHLDDFKPDKQKGKALRWFAIWMGVIVLSALLSIAVKPLADYVMYITVVAYLVAGVGASVICGIKGKRLLKLMGKGMLTLLPAVVMILVAGGIRFILSEGDVLDTILYGAITFISKQNAGVAVILIYGIVILFNMLIPSGSAKAFLIMPIIFDICAALGINPQVAVLAFAFGDGFSNVILPTNPGLLLMLGLTTVDYPKWFRWSIPIQLALLAATVGILMLAQYVVYV